MTGIRIVAVDKLDLRFAPRPWPFADERRADIAAYFAQQRRARPALWNGPILLAHDVVLMDTVFRASFFASDFASFMAWRDWDFPDPGAKNCFAMAAIRTRDDAFLLGVMGTHTSNPGHIYFPSGTPDPDDIVGTRVDFDGSVWREVVEETGLSRAELDAAPGWHAVFAGPRIALIKTLAARSSEETIRQRVLDFLAGQAQSELSGVRIVRSPADFDPRMPDFVTAFLAHIWK